MMQQPSSLLVVADSLEGGMGAAVLAQCERFARAGWRVDLAAPAAMASGAAEGIRLHELDVPDSAFRLAAMLGGARHARRLLHDLDPDIVHAHGLRTLGVLAACGRRPFVTMHSSGRNPGQTTVGTWIRSFSRGIAPLFARGAFSVVPVARGRWTTMLVPSPRLEALDEVSPNEISPHPLFVFIARLAPPKRPERFVDAMAALRERVPAAEGVVLGEGPARALLEARIRATGAPVRLLGQVEDPTPWYRQAWGVCLLSDFESLPFVVQEAMWAGRPVVCSDLPGVKWFAGETVRYVRGMPATVDALFELCDPSVRDARGRTAQARARNRLSSDKQYQTLIDAYGVRAKPHAWEGP